jgi:hypothetical protein
MSPTGEKYLREHRTDSNAVRWPDDEAARVDVGQTLLGLHYVGNADYWYEFARDVIVNPEPAKPYVRPWNEAAKKDRAYREAFATLNDEQRDAMLRLVRNVADGATFSSLVKLDQFPHADIVLQMVQRDGEVPYTVQVIPGTHGIGIHERWSEWVCEFSSRSATGGSPGAG